MPPLPAPLAPPLRRLALALLAGALLLAPLPIRADHDGT